jgi:hypothetical protein
MVTKLKKKTSCGCKNPARTVGKYSEKLSQPRSIETHGIYYNKLTEKKARDKLNVKLNHICERYYANSIPWGLIMDAAISEGFDGAMLTNIDDNRPGKVHVNIGGNTWLTVMWYIMPVSKKFEITAYAS